jgi:Carbohydrate-selective porin, OprB family/S-layer homology domain
MNRFVWSSLWLTPALLGAATLSAVASTPVASTPAIAVPATSANPVLERVEDYRNQNPALSNPDYRPAEALKQVTSVSQLTDVRPTDWAFQALQSLVERYGCIVGYPDKTFRGNQALTRYEFAAGLNSCLDRVNELIAAGTANLAKKEDLVVLQRLQEEFAAELASLRGAVGALEARTTSLERQQFSTTAKLSGEVIFSLSDVSSGRGAIGSIVSQGAGAARANVNVFNPPDDDLSVGTINVNTIRNADKARDVITQAFRVRNVALSGTQLNTIINNLNTPVAIAGQASRPRFAPPRPADLPDELVLSSRVRINFDASFNGRDRLRTRFEARNIVPYAQSGDSGNTGTNMTRLGIDGTEDNLIKIDELWYRFPIGNKLRVQIDATNGEWQDSVINTFNPLFQSSGTGAISRYGRFSPIYRLPGDGSAGITASYNFSEFNNKFTLDVGYLAGGGLTSPGNPANPAAKNGLFNGAYAALGQITFRPSPAIDLGFTYVHSYFPDGIVNLSRSTGSDLSRRPFGNNTATSGNHFGFQGVVRVSPKFTVAGWAGYTIAKAENSLDVNVSGIAGLTGNTRVRIVDRGDKADVFYWGVTLGITDLLKEGSLLGFIVGQQPKVLRNDSLFGDENASSWHFEALYRFPVNDNIDITPGLLVITNPENIGRNDSIFVGTIRTTFRF